MTVIRTRTLAGSRRQHETWPGQSLNFCCNLSLCIVLSKTTTLYLRSVQTINQFEITLIEAVSVTRDAGQPRTVANVGFAAFQMVLKGVPQVLSPDLLHALVGQISWLSQSRLIPLIFQASMGHGDRLVLSDTNFPSASICHGDAGPKLVRADGHNIPQLLQAILTLMPLDTYVFAPVSSAQSALSYLN